MNRRPACTGCAMKARTRPAKWYEAKRRVFWCDACVRSHGVSVDDLVTVERYLRDLLGGVPELPVNLCRSKKKPESDVVRHACSSPHCGGSYRHGAKVPFCTQCQFRGVLRTKFGAAAAEEYRRVGMSAQAQPIDGRAQESA